MDMSTITEKLRRFLGPEADGAGGPVTATWQGAVLAESEHTIIVEGNHYFPIEDVNSEHLEPSTRHTVCPWKGTASYYDVVVDGERNRDAAWFYPKPSHAAAQIRDHVAFWHGVKVKRTRQV
jgi:uncharacterized protein (DUF427 family)